LVGGIVTSFVLELLVYPAIYAIWRSPRDEEKVFTDDVLLAEHV